VGETVTLKVVPEPNEPPRWSVQGPGELDRVVGNPVTFIAAGQASRPVISTVADGHPLSITYRVVEPQYESVHRAKGYPLENHCAGVWMHLEIEVEPTDVSFGNVELREVSGEPSRVTGYFTRLTPEQRYHTAEGWRGLTQINNRGQRNTIADDAVIANLRPRWGTGTIEWRIPVQWRVKNSPYIGQLREAAVQTFTMSGSSGTVSVTKLGASMSRSLSDPKATVAEGQVCQ
jgi:hypothetical protein